MTWAEDKHEHFMGGQTSATCIYVAEIKRLKNFKSWALVAINSEIRTIERESRFWIIK